MAGLTKVHKIGIGVGIFCVLGAVLNSYWDHQKKLVAEEAQKQLVSNLPASIQGQWGCASIDYAFDSGKVFIHYPGNPNSNAAKDGEAFVAGSFIVNNDKVQIETSEYYFPRLITAGANAAVTDSRKILWQITGGSSAKLAVNIFTADKSGNPGPPATGECSHAAGIQPKAAVDSWNQNLRSQMAAAEREVASLYGNEPWFPIFQMISRKQTCEDFRFSIMSVGKADYPINEKLLAIRQKYSEAALRGCIN